MLFTEADLGAKPKKISPLVYIALGTNLGDRFINLQVAISAFSPKIEVLRASPVYETEPWGFLDQPAYLNQVVEVRTRLSPLGLLTWLTSIEQQMGRLPTFRYGPRLIDLDILFYGDLIIDTPQLQIPHPRMADRVFVLAPLADIAPDLAHPILKESVQVLLNRIGRAGIKKYHPPQTT